MKLFVSNCEVYLSEIAKCICLLLTNIFIQNGGLGGRLDRFVMGDQADGNTYLFGMSYPSLSAVQSAYDAIPEDVATKTYKLVSVQRRQIIRLF